MYKGGTGCSHLLRTYVLYVCVCEKGIEGQAGRGRGYQQMVNYEGVKHARFSYAGRWEGKKKKKRWQPFSGWITPP